jgi:chromosomal replication initiation ATPase DnaA
MAFDLEHRPALGRDDFIVTPSNEAAVALIDRWPDWPHPAAIIIGPEGSGKSHLAAVWCQDADATRVKARDLDAAALAALGDGCPLAIEDADEGFAEQTLFHAINLAREQGVSLLLTAREGPASWPVTLADLASRLKAAPQARLAPPDELLLRAVLVKLFSDRQLHVDVTVVDYMCRRMERSLSRAAELVERLDREALAEGRAITRNLAARLLAGEAPEPSAER